MHSWNLVYLLCGLHKLSLAKVNESIHRRDTHRLDAAAHGVRAPLPSWLLAAGLLPASPQRKETRGTGWRMWCRHLLAAGLLPPTSRRTARESKSSAAATTDPLHHRPLPSIFGDLRSKSSNCRSSPIGRCGRLRRLPTQPSSNYIDSHRSSINSVVLEINWSMLDLD